MRWMDMWRMAVALALLGTPGCRDDGPAGQDDDPDGGTDAGDDDDDDDDDDDTVDDTGDDDDDDDDGSVEYLDPVEHLVRASMALRGTRPSIADIEAVEADPDALPGIVDTYLEDPAFGEIVRDLHDDALHVGIENKFPVLPPLDDQIAPVVNRSAMQPPLRLAQHIVTNELPYTELVTADYLLVDEMAATVWGWPYDGDGDEWQVVPMDDRPAAGILAESSFFLRWESAGANYNRGRANAVSRALLCHDFQSLDIDVGTIDLSDPDAVNNAVVELPECNGCHHTLDPLASNFFGHYPSLPNADQIVSYPLPSAYIPELEDLWQQTNEREPGFFGATTNGLEDLGQQIADDPRFAQCTVMRFYGYFNQTAWQDTPPDVRDELQDALVDSGWNAKALIREIVLRDDFRLARGLDEETAETLVGVKKARPLQLAMLMEDLTGYRWELDIEAIPDIGAVGVLDLARNATAGFKVLGGAGDSLTVLSAASTVNATTSLFLRRFAEQSASFVVEQDFATSDASDRRLLRLVEPDTTDEAMIRDQLAWLHLRLYAERVEPDGEDVDAAYELFDGVLDVAGDPERAWKATLAGMLQDFTILYY